MAKPKWNDDRTAKETKGAKPKVLAHETMWCNAPENGWHKPDG